MDKTIVVLDKEIVVKGTVMFSNLTEARGFKDNDEKKTYGITIKIAAEDAEEVSTAIDTLEAAVFADATKGLTAVQKKAAGKALPKYKFVADDAGEATGELRIELKRLEKFGNPVVRTPEGTVLERKPFITKGSKVAVRATIGSYKMGSTYGTRYLLKDILLIEEADRQTSRKSNPEADKLMGVNIDDLPF